MTNGISGVGSKSPSSHRMPQNALTQPVGALMRPTRRVAPEDSISIATRLMRENGVGLLPVVTDERFQGVLTEKALTQALADGLDLDDAVGSVMSKWPTVAPYLAGAEALRTLSNMELATLVVVDDDRRCIGVLSASDLVARTRPPIRPNMVGGMASPFGVYLTTGTVSGGVPQWALMATGATMMLLLLAGTLATRLVANVAGPHPPDWVNSDTVQWLIAFGVFACGMRLIPMSGIHAAEHQVVHAIERGEELNFDIVARMPRVHPRCGTNFAAGLSIFVGFFAITEIPSTEVRALVGALAAFLLWRRLGSLLQYYVTTKPATRKDLESGIRAGKQLLDRYARAKVTRPSPLRYIWSSGMLQVMAGAGMCGLLVQLISTVFHLQWLDLVH